MSARSQLKTYIENEVKTYMPDNCTFDFVNENNNTAYANPNPDFNDSMFNITVEWIYSFQIEIIKSLGEQSELDTEDVDDAMELYRKELARQLKTQEELDANDEDVVKLKAIRSFTQSKEDMNYYTRFIIEYAVYEDYDD